MLLYRYRSIESAVKELSTSSFYFASKEELNDPLESYVRLYWQGDKSAWEGLLRNYVCSLFRAVEMYLLAADKSTLHSQTALIDIHVFKNLPIDNILTSVGDTFLEDLGVQWITDFYGGHNLKCGTKELVVVLRAVHALGLKICIETMVEHRLIDDKHGQQVLGTINIQMDSVFEKLKLAGNEWENNPILSADESERRQFFAELENIVEDSIEQQLIIIDAKRNKERQRKYKLDVDESAETFLYKNKKDERGSQLRNWLSVRINYPKIYVAQLKNMIFPPSYVVCFSENKDDSSMWGNYADNHKGVCLIYDSDELCLSTKSVAEKRRTESFEFRNLNKENSPDVINVTDKTVYRTATVKPVVYGGEVLERNFFETLGELSKKQIEGWLKGTKNISSIYDLYSHDNKDWRDEYWSALNKKTNTKHESWAHENEYRINLLDTAGVFARPQTTEDRIYEYEPKGLKGVIFGIKTSEFDMKRVLDAIPMECDISNKSDFGIFQAEYNDELQIIEIRKKFIVFKRNKSIDVAGDVVKVEKGNNSDSNAVSETSTDVYFQSQNLKYIFALCYMDGEQRNKIIGLTDEIYYDSNLAKDWYRGVIKLIHPDANSVVRADADEAVMNLNKIYERIKRSFETDNSDEVEDN